MLVVAHADDDVLGAGGYIRRLLDDGHMVKVLRMSCRPVGREPDDFWFDVLNADGVLGVTVTSTENLPDNRFDSVDLLDVVQIVEKHVTHFEPQLVLTHSKNDLNIDHRITHDAVLTACRPPGADILCFEVPSSTEWAAGQYGAFRPNFYVDISATIGVKLAAMECYKTEIRATPHPRSREMILALARKRGAECGCEYAEGFEIVRSVDGCSIAAAI